MTLAVSDLITIATLKSTLSITGTAQDPLLELAIKAASNAIAQYVGRKLHYQAGIVDRLPGHGTPELILSRIPVRAITQITYDGGTAFDASDYECVGDHAESGIVMLLNGIDAGWTSIETEGIAHNRVTGHERNLYAVTYDAGYRTPNQAEPEVGDGEDQPQDLPAAIQMAAIMVATNFYAAFGRDPTVTSESLMSASQSYGNPANVYGDSGLPVQVESLLASYRVPAQA